MHKYIAPLMGGRSVRFSLKEQVHMAKRLSFLMEAGVPLLEGLVMLETQAGRGHGRVLRSVVADVSSGHTLSRSFAKFPRVFSTFAVSIVKVGESSGTLSHSLNYLALELKKKQILRSKLIGAFVYPGVIAVATLGITAFLMLYLFPKLTPVFTSLGAELPLSTRIVMGTSIFLQHWGLLTLLGFFFTAAVFWAWMKHSDRVHLLFDTAMLRLPFVGSVLKYYHLAGSTRTLGLLLKSGLKLSEATHLTAQTTHNRVYSREFTALARTVERGERMSVYTKAHRRYFPLMFAHMLAVGERSGSLPGTLAYLSELYEHEVDEYTKNLSTLLEPALMIFMGLLVGFVSISIITPIYGITQNLHG